ncbi:hypothetical protein [Runella salmonicolor]|uniref:Uncharacterized protein n=1 Tax=Runella salmonicolor TaxID=2950278 RepID=A0ABT1FTA2_9BACT|nr:hypothetical protein [Runella salmonicolor]MCP1384996.1 hypothetical protein [Runella salmonicolor]
MLKRNDNLIVNRGLDPLQVQCYTAPIVNDNQSFIDNLTIEGILPPNPPFELHPYISELHLEKYEKYIIGTFPPISYILDHPAIIIPIVGIPTRPWIPFYHGNRGSMWEYLLTNPEYAALEAIIPLPNNLNPAPARIAAKNFLIAFLQKEKINYSDIIQSVQRVQYNANDTGLRNICINKDLICHILTNENAKYLLFNTGSTFSAQGLQIHQNANVNGVVGNVNVAKSQAFDLFVRGCQDMGLTVAIRIQHGPTLHFNWTTINIPNTPFLQTQMHNKVAFEIQVSNPNNLKLPCGEFKSPKILTVITGPSPSPIALLGLANNQNYLNWVMVNPGANQHDFIEFIYQNFRGHINLDNFYDLNV